MLVDWNYIKTALWIAEVPDAEDPFEIRAHNYDCGYFIVESFETREQAERYLNAVLNERNSYNSEDTNGQADSQT